MTSKIGCKELPEASSELAEQVLAFFKANAELYFTQKELVMQFAKSNPRINKILRELVASKKVQRKKVQNRFYYRI